MKSLEDILEIPPPTLQSKVPPMTSDEALSDEVHNEEVTPAEGEIRASEEIRGEGNRNKASASVFVEALIPVEDPTSIIADPTITIEPIVLEPATKEVPSTYVIVATTEASSIVEINFESYAASFEGPSHTPSTAVPIKEVLLDPTPSRPRFEFEAEALAPPTKRSKT